MRRFLVLAAAFVIALVVAGNAGAASLAHQPDVSKLDPIELTFCTMSMGSSTNVMTSNMVSVIEPYLPKGSRINVTTDMAGGAVAPFMISTGMADLAIGDSTPNEWAAAGITPGREGQVAENVAAFGGSMFYSTIIVLFAEGFEEKSGCSTLEELVAKKYPIVFATKVFGSFGAMSMDMIFKVLGITEEDIKSWGGDVIRVDTMQALDMIKDKRAHVYIDHNNRYHGGVIELLMTSNVKFIQLADSTLNGLEKLGYAPARIEAKSFTATQPATDIDTAASAQCFIMSAKLPDEYAYLITMAVCEERDKLVAMNANFTTFEPAKAWVRNGLGFDLHPGALLYYKDKGYIK
ncbi:MAG: TAXI family TRAP transporter solute-binding subunit [Planctomycetota bacterium]|nr:TAXI family TRAP transporter solute-binding subunit [Planctomycetota bacterium]